MKNKKGLFGFSIFYIAIFLIIFLVLIIVASILGLRFADKIVDIFQNINKIWFIIILLAPFLYLYRGIIQTVLMTIWGWIVAIITAILGMLKI